MPHRVGLALALLLSGRSVLEAQPPVTLGTPIKPAFAVRVAGPERVRLGSPFGLRIQVVNGGDVVHAGRIRVELGDGLQHPQGRVIEADLPGLRPGECKDIDLNAVARQVGKTIVVVRVRADSGQETAASVDVQVTGPALELHLSGPEHRSLGRDAKFDLDVWNSGNEADENVCVTAMVPEGLDFASAGDRGAYDAQSRQVRWRLGTLAPQQHRGLTLHLLAQGVGTWDIQATAAADSLPGVTDLTTTQVDAVPTLLLEAADSIDPVAVGAETQYEIRVLNRGSTAATHVQVFATVPDGLTPLDADGPTKADIDSQQVIFTPLPKLAPGAEAVYRLQARGVRPGAWRLKVQVFSDQLRIPLAEDENTRVYGQEAQVGKGQ